MTFTRTSKTGLKAATIKTEELYGVLLQADGESGPLPDEAISAKIFAAEDFYERDLQITFGERRVFSDPQGRASAAAPLTLSDFNPTADLSDPAYDIEVGQWNRERWGLIKLRRRPIRAVAQVIFAWVPQTIIWTVPPEWVVLDRAAGTLQIKPTTGQLSVLTFAAFIGAFFLEGRGLPHSIYVDYTVGYTNDELWAWHADLLEGVRLRTLLTLMGILTTVRNQGQMSGSLALDGMSESRGWGGKYGAYSGAITLAVERELEIRKAFREKDRGVCVAFA